jgi:hypothetical protein
MEIKKDENIKCENCGNLFEDGLTTCWECRKKQVHNDTVKFLSDLQKAQEATRNTNTYFGPGPDNQYGCNMNEPTQIKTIHTTPKQMEEVIKNAKIVVKNIPPWRVINKPTYEELENICNTIIKASGIHLKTNRSYSLADTCEDTNKIIHLAYCFDCEEINLFHTSPENGQYELKCHRCNSDYIITIEELNAYKPMSERTKDEEDLAIYGNLDNIFDHCEIDYSWFTDIKIKINQVYEYAKTL